MEKAKAISGEQLLRNIMLDNKIELYATYVSFTIFDGNSSAGSVGPFVYVAISLKKKIGENP